MTGGRERGSVCGLDPVPPAPLAGHARQASDPPPASVPGVLPWSLVAGDGEWLMAMTPDARARCCRALACVERGGFYDDVRVASGLSFEQIRGYTRNYPGFLAAWLRAVSTREWQRTMMEDDEAHKRAVVGEAIHVMRNGECIGVARMKSDRLLEKLLDRAEKRRAPQPSAGEQAPESTSAVQKRPVMPPIPEPKTLDEWVLLYRKMRTDAALERQKQEGTPTTQDANGTYHAG
jgi:hypothetical protein